MFSDILLTADFDYTTTGKDGTIPTRNIEAIEYFIANGGAFCINTGRSLPMATQAIEQVPMNAPMLLYNGGLAYDIHKKQIVFADRIGLDLEATMRKMEALFPELVTEVEGIEAHYLFKENPLWNDFCANNRCKAQVARFGDDLGPFLKFCVYGPLEDNTVAGLYRGTQEQIAYFDQVEALVRQHFGADTAVYRAAARIVDVHPKASSKGAAARKLQEMLGRKRLVCIGDGENDVPMLREADFGFCPAGSRVADRFENVCTCSEGAIADVVYRKLPQILEKRA